MTWEIFLGISSLSAFMISIMAIVVKVTKTLTAIETSLNLISQNLETEKRENEKEHSDFSKRLKETEKNCIIQKIKIENLERM